jgi:hypothetical protein
MRFLLIGAVALVGVVALAACGDPKSEAAPPASPAATASTTPPATEVAPTTTSPTPARTTTTGTTTTRTPTRPPVADRPADVSRLVRLGIILDQGVLIDVADDGVDRFLAVGAHGVVDFTGTGRTDATMMALKAAPGGQRDQVRIQPPFWNEDLGAGSCVADTAGAALALETCRTGRPAQVWTVVPAGDSGQFELRGAYGILRVDDGRLVTGTGGRSGLQTIDFAR